MISIDINGTKLVSSDEDTMTSDISISKREDIITLEYVKLGITIEIHASWGSPIYPKLINSINPSLKMDEGMWKYIHQGKSLP